MPTQEQFNEAEAYILDRINHYSTVRLELTGDKILGEEVWKDGKLKTPGLGFGPGLRNDLQNDINGWLRERPHSRLLHAEEVAADVTVEDLVNYVAYSLL